MRFQDISGKRFGKLIVIRHHSQARQKNGAAFNRWECRCDCGNVFVARGEYIKYGKNNQPNWELCTQCRESAKRARSEWYEPVKNIHSGMLGRCENERTHLYHRYGGRGIRVCERWRTSIEAFAEDMGPRPSPSHSVDRIDNDGNYSCGKCEECIRNGWLSNCRWATVHEQILNSTTPRFIEYNGERLCMAEWARQLGISREAMRVRVNRAIRKGKPASYAITMTPSPGRR